MDFLSKLSDLKLNFTQTLGHLKPALNNSAQISKFVLSFIRNTFLLYFILAQKHVIGILWKQVIAGLSPAHKSSHRCLSSLRAGSRIWIPPCGLFIGAAAYQEEELLVFNQSFGWFRVLVQLYQARVLEVPFDWMTPFYSAQILWVSFNQSQWRQFIARECQ